MAKVRKLLRSPVTTLVLFALAAVLLLTGTIGGVRASPLLEADSFSAQVGTASEIGASLVENGAAVGDSGVLLENLVPEGESLLLGRVYDESLAVENTGTMDIYVRVSVYRYWTDANGDKLTVLSPELIELDFMTDNGWVVDEDASTSERVVLYYTQPLAPGETTSLFADKLSISGEVAMRVSQEVSGGAITTTRDYSGVSFHLKAEADAVQTHNAEAAVLSAWGRHVTVDDDGAVRLS